MKRQSDDHVASVHQYTVDLALHRCHAMGLAFLFVFGFFMSHAGANDADLEIGNKRADMLRAGRTVVPSSQDLINDAEIGDKVVREATAIYEERVGTPPLDDDLSERDKQLLEAQMQAIRQVVDAHQANINRPGIGFKGFIPATFAR